jgi:hypothetical protein
MIRYGRRAFARLARLAAILAMGFPLAGITSLEALFAPKAELWERWQAHDPASSDEIDHEAWGRLLTTYLLADSNGVNRFDYGGVSTSDRKALDGYVAGLAALPIDAYNRSEQLAYWVNLYNALTIQVVLAHYPVESIRDIDISPGLFADGPWGKPLVSVAGEALTLNDIEHRILRPIWKDPRIHYAVNCASVGCPDLQTVPFTGRTADALLDRAARDYVNSARGVWAGKDGLVVSSIYIWFKDDFGGNDKAVIAHLSRYADAQLSARIAQTPKLVDHDYDWSLNDRVRQ